MIVACAGNPPGQAPDVVIEQAHSGGSALAFSSDSRLAASGGWSGRLHIWSMPEGGRVGGWQAHQGQVNGIVFLHGDSRLLTGGYDKMIVLWSAQGELLRSVSTASPILHLIALPARDLIITAHEDGVVRQWRLSDFELTAEHHHHRDAAISVAIHADSGRIASSGKDGEVWLWNSDEKAQRLGVSLTDVRTLAFSQDGQRLYGGTWFDLFRWNLTDGVREVLKTEHKGIIKQIQFTPDGSYLASISRQTDSAVLLLNADNGTTARRFHSHELCGGAISVSPDGRYLATTSDDASVRFWKLL